MENNITRTRESTKPFSVWMVLLNIIYIQISGSGLFIISVYFVRIKFVQRLSYYLPTTDLSLGLSQLERALLLQSKSSLLYSGAGQISVQQVEALFGSRACGLLAASTPPSTTSSIAKLRSKLFVQTPNISCLKFQDFHIFFAMKRHTIGVVSKKSCFYQDPNLKFDFGLSQ